ncbi:MAG: hypothetical protein V7K89_25000 [Nostoc sp.]|uniref:hypothetical protein n=1 Tax=Nostoc sp. TaxID=1180 RepID=UPI002FFA859A
MSTIANAEIMIMPMRYLPSILPITSQGFEGKYIFQSIDSAAINSEMTVNCLACRENTSTHINSV